MRAAGRGFHRGLEYDGTDEGKRPEGALVTPRSLALVEAKAHRLLLNVREIGGETELRAAVKPGLEEAADQLATAIDAGAADVGSPEGGSLIVATEPGQLERVRSALAAAGYPAESAEVSMEPRTWVEIADEKIARQVLTFVERLEDLDDVQNVYANFDIPTQLMEQLEASVV